MQGDVSFTFDIRIDIEQFCLRMCKATMYDKKMSLQLLAFRVNSYVIISQKNLPFSGTIEIPNLKGEQSIGKKSGKCR